MALNVCDPYYDDGDEITGLVTQREGISGKRFVAIDTTGTGRPASRVSDSVAGGNVPVRYPSAGGDTIGVSGYDAREQHLVKIVRGAGVVVPIKAGAAIEAGEFVTPNAEGEAVPVVVGGVAATRVTGRVEVNNAILWTSRARGSAGNRIRVVLVDPARAEGRLEVIVEEDSIRVNLATDRERRLISTAAQVIAAVRAQEDASQKVVAANYRESRGEGAVAAEAEGALEGGADQGASRGRCWRDVRAGEDAVIELLA